MDRIDAMRLFTRVVEQRSFTQAAQDLNLPRSTVTDAIKQLEARLQVRLLQRTTRHVSPTLDGEAYYQRCLEHSGGHRRGGDGVRRRQTARAAAHRGARHAGAPFSVARLA